MDLAVPIAWIGSAEEQRPERGPAFMGNSLVGEQSHAAVGLRDHRWKPHAGKHLHIRPEIRQEHPLNLSISISGGEETNQDSPSSGERTGKSPT